MKSKNIFTTIFIRIYIILFFLGFFFSVFGNSEGSSNDYARITDVDYTAVVVDEYGSNGKVVITERLTYDVHAASKDELFWELWRALPEQYVDGVKVSYKVNSVKQILDDGTEIYYSESPKLYWDDSDFLPTSYRYGPGKWFHSEGPYDEAARNYECVLFYVDGLYREKVTFEIEYEMYNAALRYNDCSELYLSMYSEDTIKHLKSYKGQILIPNEDMPSKGNYDAHTYGTNANSFPFTESDSKNYGYHTFSFELDEEDLQFRPYNKYLEFTLVSYGDDKHIFAEHASHNDHTNDNVLDEIREEQKKYDTQPERYKKAKTVLLVISSLGAILIIKYALKTDERIKKKHTLYQPTMQMQYFREIPSDLDPHFAAKLAFCKSKKQSNDSDIYSAIMLSLVRKKYIELEKIDPMKDWTSENVKVIIKYKPSTVTPLIQEGINNIQGISKTEINTPKLESLTTTEQYYFDLIMRHSKGNEISMKDFQSRVTSDYANTDSFVRNIENSTAKIGTTYNYFQKADYKQPKNQLKGLSVLFTILGIISIFLVNIISYQTRLDFAFGSFLILGIALIWSAHHIKKLSRKYILLTQFGEDEYAKWYGLYNFLNSETLMSERTVVELPLWEQYLVYATAFGISEKVIKALKIRCPDIQSSPMLSNNFYCSTNFRTYGRSFHSSTRTASYTARSGGHGGYGGGGRGGGGGGGGH